MRAWTIHAGDTAPQAAGVIHTDFERGFIRAQTIAFDDFIAYKGEAGAKEAGQDARRRQGRVHLHALAEDCSHPRRQRPDRNYVANFSEPDANSEAADRLAYLAYHDPLTNLPNRLAFESQLARPRYAFANGKNHHWR